MATTHMIYDPWRDGTTRDVAHWGKGRRMEVHVRVTQEFSGGPEFIDIRDFSPEDAANGSPPWGQGVWFRADQQTLDSLIEALVQIRNGAP